MSTMTEITEAVEKVSRKERLQLFERLRAEFEPEDPAWIREQLRSALEQEARGEFAPMDFAAIKAEGRRRLAAERGA